MSIFTVGIRKRKEKSGSKRVRAAAEELMKWATAHERLGTAVWSSVRPRELKKKKTNTFLLSVLLLRDFRSSKLTPKPACIFHDPHQLTPPPPSLSLGSVAHLLHVQKAGPPCTHRRIALSTRSANLSAETPQKKEKNPISLTYSLPNSEWHFIQRRRPGRRDTRVDKRKQKMSEWMQREALQTV